MHSLDQLREIEYIPLENKNHPRITDWIPITGEEWQENKKAPTIDLKQIYLLPFVKIHYKRPPNTVVGEK